MDLYQHISTNYTAIYYLTYTLPIPYLSYYLYSTVYTPCTFIHPSINHPPHLDLISRNKKEAPGWYFSGIQSSQYTAAWLMLKQGTSIPHLTHGDFPGTSSDLPPLVFVPEC